MNLLAAKLQCFAVESRVAIALTDIDDILPYVGAYDEERLFATSDAETFALTDGVKMGSLMFANLLAVAHSVTPRLGEGNQVVICNVAIEFWPLGLDLVDVALRSLEFLLQKYR